MAGARKQWTFNLSTRGAPPQSMKVLLTTGVRSDDNSYYAIKSLTVILRFVPAFRSEVAPALHAEWLE